MTPNQDPLSTSERLGETADPRTPGARRQPPKPSTNGRNGHGRGDSVLVTRVVDADPLPSSTESETFDWDTLLPERSRTLRWRLGQAVKRVFDFACSGLLLLVLAPVLVVAALLVKLTSRGPVFYACEYVGYRGRRFRGYKLRTMVADAEERKAELMHLNHMKGPAFKIRNDPRVTPVGRVLRKFSIDELPQLWNVLRGDMSLVGPRPPLPEEWERYKGWQRAKLAVIPGITCYWQIEGRSDIVDFDEWARMDLRYIERWTVWEDLKILARTIPAVLAGRGAY